MASSIKDLCLAPQGQAEILQGNIAFAVGCVRGGVHSADGYPGTPSSEVIDNGLAHVQDLITVGWSTNEAVASAVGQGHTIAGRDCVVTMKIPGLYQAGDIFTSGAMLTQERGALVYFIASDFTPSSTQHIIDPRYLFKSCFVPVLEPRNHQELHESAALAVDIARRYQTQVVIMPNGNLCHSEGLIHLMPPQTREPVVMPESLRGFNVLPGLTRKNYDRVMAERMPALEQMVAASPLNHWEKGKGKRGVITCGISDLYVREVRAALDPEMDLLSLAFTNPLPLDLIRQFCESIDGEIYVIEDGYRYLQEAVERLGFKVKGKPEYSPITEWTPALIAGVMGVAQTQPPKTAAAVTRPPLICAGCPYRLIAQELIFLRRKNYIDAVFGDIGCNSLLYFMQASDTSLAMGASEAERIGYVLSRPEQAGRCLSILGDSTECHSGLDATRNAAYRNVPGVKVILDNEYTAMTGGQPSPTSPENLAGQPMHFDLPATLRAHGAKVEVISAYDRKHIRKTIKEALEAAANGAYTTIVVREGPCLKKSKPSTQRVYVDPEVCRKCGMCQICPGISVDENKVPYATNLCSGCGGHTPSCVQMCPHKVLHAVDLKDLNRAPVANFGLPPEVAAVEPPAKIPSRLALAIRGVGGQGNLFFGNVISRLALLAGYADQNILKGETHGMAQMGGPVISTFCCGDVISPVLMPQSADCLIVMEKSEVLRPGFLEMLKPGGTVLLATTKIVPHGSSEDQYPTDEQIAASLEGYRVVEVDVLGRALELGDPTGRIANVVMMGVLSTLPPFDAFPPELWLSALQQANARPVVWYGNYAAFTAGRETGKALS